MRLLVIGGSGLVGSHVLAEAKSRGHMVTGTYRHCVQPGMRPLDLADPAAAAAIFDAVRPDWVVHAAGWTWVDGCENDPARARRENCEQPVTLAKLCRQRGCRFAFFSTSYVFDGAAGPYAETDQPNPINVYGRSKWEAEQQIQEILSGEGLILRTICVWGREFQRKNFVYQVIKSLNEGRIMRLPADQFGNPSWAGDLAWWLLELMEQGEKGVWNLAGDQANCNRVEWFCAIRDQARALGLVPAGDQPGYEAGPTRALGQPALRPLQAGLRIERVRERFPRKLRKPADIAELIPGN